MNKKQLIAMWVGIATAVLMLLFPPFEIHTLYGGVARIAYRCLLQSFFERGLTDISVSILCVQFVILSLIIGGLIIGFSDKNKNTNKEVWQSIVSGLKKISSPGPAGPGVNDVKKPSGTQTPTIKDDENRKDE